ncbi:hypothetical protein [uncultured Photobacterium sp.]|uniref:hypothetical protein n=1 Tax=uncultured Photobacterium sp. TaxID=173973 RepID=UPI002630B445|nr:hypothetical protein [uncultured Photobacterium sp.]
MNLQDLKNISTLVGLPKVFKDDLDLDHLLMNKYPKRTWLWVLKEAGSQLFPIKSGVDPRLVTHWLSQSNIAIFLVTDTSITSIGRSECEKLANEMPFDVKRFASARALIDAVSALLGDSNVTTLGLVPAPHCPTTTSWTVWYKWFKGKQPVMEIIMKQAIEQLIAINNKEVA